MFSLITDLLWRPFTFLFNHLWSDRRITHLFITAELRNKFEPTDRHL